MFGGMENSLYLRKRILFDVSINSSTAMTVIHSDESQNIEFKESWNDKYLQWICGFANAQGGRMFIGVNDKHEVVGVDNSKKLMEDIPNKVRDVLGIIVDVNLLDADGLAYVEVVVEAYPYPISYRGHYYQRSGATNQELKGAALDRFMLRRQGKTWDGVPVPYLTVDDLDNATFDLFRRYAKLSRRMEEADLQDDNKGLLEKLRLYEGSYLKRAAALLFHPDPEKYVTGAFVKIGFFREDADLVYQDEIHGNLFQQIHKLMDLLCTKYLKAVITYEGIQRIETFPMPREALREALLNACINKDYSDTSPIQIRVTDNMLQIVNGGVLPDGWTVDTLLSSHRSMPYNPDIANTFFRAGEVEAWGRGIERIIKGCNEDGFSTVDFRYDACGLWTTFRYQYPVRVVGNTENFHENALVGHEKGMKRAQKGYEKILEFIKDNPQISIPALAKEFGITVKAMRLTLDKLKAEKRISRIGPNKGGYWQVMDMQ